MLPFLIIFGFATFAATGSFRVGLFFAVLPVAVLLVWAMA